jgi:hypothetical protein
MQTHHVSQDNCRLPCFWHHHEKCVLCLVSCEQVHRRQVSLGVLEGLRHAYYPGELPPCVGPAGELDCTGKAERVASREEEARVTLRVAAAC